MKSFFTFLVVFNLLLGIVYAQEVPKYNFASMQADKALRLTPGEEGITKLYFFNIEGNRNTHIALSVGEAPDNWDISFEPALHKSTILVSGVPTTFTENLYVEPSEALDKVSKEVPKDVEYISTAVGYVEAKPLEIKIKVPSDERLGKIGKIRIDALASWAGQAGAAAITQSRSFDYTVTVVSKEFTETILERAPEKKEEVVVVKEVVGEKAEEEKASVPAPQVVEKEIPVGVPTSTFVGVVVILLIVIVIMFISFVMKKK
jgi:hypothetical protein